MTTTPTKRRILRQLLAGAMLCSLPGAALAQNQVRDSADTIIVTGERQYDAEFSSTASKTDIANTDIPQSIEVRTRALINDLGGTMRADAIARTVAGITVQNGNGGTNQPFLVLRGFPNYGVALRDGYLRPNSFYGSIDDANIERVEFLKGPSSVLYGQTGSLGGTVNYISRRPGGEARTDLSLTGGTYGFVRGVINSGGAVADGNWHYRFDASAERGDSFREYVDHRSIFVAPALAYAPTDSDRVTILTSYNATRNNPNFGLPLTPLALDIPRERYFQQPGFDRGQYQGVEGLIEYRHAFHEGSDLILTYAADHFRWRQHYVYPGIDEVDPTFVTRDANYERISGTDHTIEARWTERFSTGPIGHNMLIGSMATWTDFDYWTTDYGTFDGGLPGVSIFDTPDYSVQPTNLADPGRSVSNTRTLAAYAQDLISLTSTLKVMVGVRYDSIHISTTGSGAFDSPTTRESFSHVTPRAGVVFQPVAGTSVYFGYATSFLPSSGVDRIGKPFKPEQGQLYEVGLKQKFGNALDLNIAVYQLTRQNVFAPDPVDPNFSIQTGEERSRGIEFDLNGEIGQHLRLTAAYAYTNAKVTSDDSFPIGTRLFGAPRHAANLFAVYSLAGRSRGLELGGGIHYESAVSADMPNTFRLPENVALQLFAKYPLTGRIEIQLNLDNVTDHHNYSSSGGSILVGDPFTAFLRVGVRL